MVIKRDIAVGLSQLVKFNAIKRKRGQSVLHIRHINSQENPLTVYIDSKKKYGE